MEVIKVAIILCENIYKFANVCTYEYNYVHIFIIHTRLILVNNAHINAIHFEKWT